MVGEVPNAWWVKYQARPQRKVGEVPNPSTEEARVVGEVPIQVSEMMNQGSRTARF